MLLGDLAQPLEIALRRRQHAGRSGHRLDDHGGDGVGAVQIDQPLQFIGEMRAIFRLALAEGLLFPVVGRRDVIDAGQQRSVQLAVIDDASHRSSAKTDAVIAALAADQPGAAALALDLVKSQRDLERGVGGLRAGIAEEDVIEPGGREIGDAARKLKGLWNAELEWRGIIQRLGHLADRGGNLAAAVAGVAAPHARRGVDDLAAIDGKIMHVLGAGEQSRRLLEGPVGGERHPMRREVVGHVDGGGEWALVQHSGLLMFRSVWLSKLPASLRHGNADGPRYFRPLALILHRSRLSTSLRDRRRRSRTLRHRNLRCPATSAAIAERRPPAPRGHGRSRITARLRELNAGRPRSGCGG